jgi:hypothetical protein
MTVHSSTNCFIQFAAAASVLAAGAAFAHPHEEVDGKDKVKVMIMSDKKGGKEAMERMREFRMLRGPNGDVTCPDGKAANVDETTGGERTKILICGNDKLTGAERAKRLEEMLAKMRANNSLGGEHKAKVEAALQQAIERARAAN